MKSTNLLFLERKEKIPQTSSVYAWSTFLIQGKTPGICPWNSALWVPLPGILPSLKYMDIYPLSLYVDFLNVKFSFPDHLKDKISRLLSRLLFYFLSTLLTFLTLLHSNNHIKHNTHIVFICSWSSFPL